MRPAQSLFFVFLLFTAGFAHADMHAKPVTITVDHMTMGGSLDTFAREKLLKQVENALRGYDPTKTTVICAGRSDRTPWIINGKIIPAGGPLDEEEAQSRAHICKVLVHATRGFYVEDGDWETLTDVRGFVMTIIDKAPPQEARNQIALNRVVEDIRKGVYQNTTDIAENRSNIAKNAQQVAQNTDDIKHINDKLNGVTTDVYNLKRQTERTYVPYFLFESSGHRGGGLIVNFDSSKLFGINMFEARGTGRQGHFEGMASIGWSFNDNWAVTAGAIGERNDNDHVNSWGPRLAALYTYNPVENVILAVEAGVSYWNQSVSGINDPPALTQNGNTLSITTEQQRSAVNAGKTRGDLALMIGLKF